MHANLSKYQGEWVIVARNSVVAHGKDLNKLFSEVDRKCPNEERITFNVPKKGVYVL